MRCFMATRAPAEVRGWRPVHAGTKSAKIG
jgi:hypothetical protein